MIEKINNHLIQPVSPVEKSKDKDNTEKRRADRMRKAEEELKKKQKLEDKKNKIDVFA